MSNVEMMSWLDEVGAWIGVGLTLAIGLFLSPQVSVQGGLGVILRLALFLPFIGALLLHLSRGVRLRQAREARCRAVAARFSVLCRGGSSGPKEMGKSRTVLGQGLLLVDAAGDFLWWTLDGSVRRTIEAKAVAAIRVERHLRFSYPMIAIDTYDDEIVRLALQKPRGLMWRYGATSGEAEEIVRTLRRCIGRNS